MSSSPVTVRLMPIIPPTGLYGVPRVPTIGHRKTGNLHRMASDCVPGLVALEIAQAGSPAIAQGPAGVDP